jgi:diguanylate cyclase (GGDEF)-like protein/PAS domain S-box-containing protein
MVRDGAGSALYCEGTVTDVTQRKAAERALYEEKERAEVTLKSIGDAVVTTDASGNVLYLNPVAEQLTGWERRLARGRPVEEVIPLKDDANGELVESPVLRCLREGRLATLAENSVLVNRDGLAIAIQDSAAPIRDHDGNVVGAVLVFHDVSRERQLHRKLSYHASHDSLTGLINRREFEERVSQALRNVKQGTERDYALLYMDLDQFKIVNDTCGHAAGDLLLRQMAELLQARVRTSDVVGRLGGDEFAVLLADCTLEKARELADLLREAVAGFRFSWQEGSMQVGVSIGIVPLCAESENIGSLFSAADVACYVAKDLGRNRVHVYEEGDSVARHEEMQWVTRISRAREQERFELYYQPIVPIGKTERVFPQFELLLRMRDERGELVSPNTFIPAAERYNLMQGLDRWVISEVLDSLIYRPQMNCEPYMLAVNVSGTTLNDAKFLDYLQSELAAAQIDEGTLCFEITETAAISNLDRTVQFMRTLKERGCRFSLDDFGTGLSSLTYLKNLPVDYVKIDGQFIRNVLRDAADESVVEAIAKMAAAFKIHTIAERVESRDVLARLAEIGIAYAQGFFIAVPQPVSDLPIRSMPRRLQA